MEKRKGAGLLSLPYPLRTVPLGMPGPLSRLQLRDPWRVYPWRLDAAGWERPPAPGAPRRPYLPLPLDGAFEPAFLRKRNERERQRVRCVNEGYARLREHLPRELAGRRLSKVETLRAAIGYIKQLQELLERHARGPEAADSAGPSARAECNSDGESKTSSAPSPCCSEAEEGGV
ncbi:achaete-scute homolog 4 [Suncus etruscus]|uniref:achaete-scute homolog 4 n=1 Tax=Suncus etruscus TaxID=109475 RepID=UPI002110327E|nr:achaete-scute homolog 4 [Suncus etruscus]